MTEPGSPDEATIRQAILEEAIGVLPPPGPTVPGAASWAELEALCVQVGDQGRKPDRFRCHPIVMHALRTTLPPALDYPSVPVLSQFYLDVDVTIELPYGGWELLEGDQVIESGVINE